MRTEADLRDALQHLADRAPAGDRLLDPTSRRPVHHPRALVLAVAVGVVVVALACGWFLLARDRVVRPVAPLPGTAGAWTTQHRVDPPTGWSVVQEVMYVDDEQSVLRPAGSNGDRSCYVDIARAAGAPDNVNGEQTTLAGRSGIFTPKSDEANATFTWDVADNVWASVSCAGMADPKARIASVVPGLHDDPHELVLPFSLTGLPEGLMVTIVYQGRDPDQDTQGIDLGDASGGLPRASVYLWNQDPRQQAFGGTVEDITLAGKPGIWIPSTSTACFTGVPTLCITEGEDGAGSSEISSTIQELAGSLRPAPDLSDQSTWPTASDALPR